MRILALLASLVALPAAAQQAPPQPPPGGCDCGVPANPRGPR